MLLFDFFPEDPHDSILHFIICLHFPRDWCRSRPCPGHAPPSKAALFGSDWDVWNKKKRLCQQYNTHDTFCLHNIPPPPTPPHQSLTVSNAIKILELQRWWLNAQLLIFSGRYSTPLSNYGRNQMNCKWNKFPPEHFRFISTCFRFWEHISSIASFIAIISNHYFLLKKEITFETWKISCFEQPVPISCKWKFSKISRITEVLGICIHF